MNGIASIRPTKILGPVFNPGPLDIRQVIIVNPSAVTLWVAEDQESANAISGTPIFAGAERPFLWNTDIWVGADIDNVQFRYMMSAKLSSPTQTWEALRKATPPPPGYYNRPR